MNIAWHLALRGSGENSEKFGGSEVNGAPFASEESFWSCKNEGERKGVGEGCGGGLGGQDKVCRIQISREALPSHPDLIGSSPEIRCVYYLCPARVEVSAGRVLGQRGGEKAGLGRAPLLSANPFE